MIDTYEKAIEIINTIGKFRNLYEITCDEKTLINRYKAKEGIAEDLGEEQMTAFKETLDKPTKLLEEIKKLCANVIPVNTDASEEKTKLLFDFSFGRNFIVIKHEYDINIEKNLELFAAKNKLLYINVPKLLYKHFAENDEISKKLEDSYGKKTLTNEITDESNFEGYIYYKYNPIHFETSLVNQIILQYANEHYKEIEKSGNFILLSGYLNYDLLPENELPFNLPLFELKNTMELGDLTAFIAITSKEIKEVEDEEAIQLVIEKPKKVVQKDPLDVDGAEGAEENQEQPPEEQPPEEENADGAPKFKPAKEFGEAMTQVMSDAGYKKELQVLCKYINTTPETLRNILYEICKENNELKGIKEPDKIFGLCVILIGGYLAKNISSDRSMIITKFNEVTAVLMDPSQNKNYENLKIEK